MDNAGDTNNNSKIFIYTGGRVPEHLKRHITHAIIDKSSVKCHKGVEIVGKCAFWGCNALRAAKLPGAKIIGLKAFYWCDRLEEV
eukprot:scaffold12631_cov133-Skeletonema_marinoi.AAC.7